MLVFTDLFGRQIHLTSERWEKHILAARPFLGSWLEKLGEVLEKPDSIKASNYDPEVVIYYRLYEELLDSKFLAIVVKLDPEGRNFILTAYPTDAIKEGKTLWPIT